MIFSVQINILLRFTSSDLLAVFFLRLHSVIPRFLYFAYFKSVFYKSSADFSNLDDDVISLPMSLSTSRTDSALKEFRFSITVGRDFVKPVSEAI